MYVLAESTCSEAVARCDASTDCRWHLAEVAARCSRDTCQRHACAEVQLLSFSLSGLSLSLSLFLSLWSHSCVPPVCVQAVQRMWRWAPRRLLDSLLFCRCLTAEDSAQA